ncbi:MAG: HEAT repeat domain-containing protein [Pirellulales bacterium]|nr:HEAT repeat domain-containing protein [Pirellulales bacterium]
MASTHETDNGLVAEIPKLLESLKSDDPVVRRDARESLVSVGLEAVIPLIHQLKSPLEQVRWEAAKALGAIGDESAANTLADALDDEISDVRWVAARALVDLGREGLKQTLIALLTNAASVGVRDGAGHVVSHFAQYVSGYFLKPLLPLFHGFEPAVTIPPAALRCLHELQQREQSRRSGEGQESRTAI